MVAGRGLTHKHSWLTEQMPPARPIRQFLEAPGFSQRTSVGLDLHAQSIAAAVIDGETGEVSWVRLAPAPVQPLGSIGRLNAEEGRGATSKERPRSSP